VYPTLENIFLAMDAAKAEMEKVVCILRQAEFIPITKV
jgi:hypothetical protein